jgi:CheY-like chemotaxis protein
MNKFEKVAPFVVGAGGGGRRPAEFRRQPADGTMSDSASVPARILVVEDQEDVRRMLVAALEIEGHRVDDAASAAEGLRRLEDGRYDLVLSDYAMPGGTGTWMLHEATRRGLMDATVALIVTAHPDVRDLADVQVILKPLDLDLFLEQVRRILDSGRLALDPARPSRDEEAAVAMRTGDRATHRVELVLYISSASPASIQARRNLERLLSEFEPSQVKVTICDMIRDPLAGEADRIAFTPTLVKRFPEPRMWMLGNLRETEVLADLLRVCGVDARE